MYIFLKNRPSLRVMLMMWIYTILWILWIIYIYRNYNDFSFWESVFHTVGSAVFVPDLHTLFGKGLD